MKKKLLNATTKFSLNCLAKLSEKEEQGYVGWDDRNQAVYFSRKIIAGSMPFTQQDLVNKANYCNFLWNLIENGKGGN